jgi:hypothetical protein
MSINFPRLDPNLIITTGVEAPTSIKPVEAIKQEILLKLSQIGLGNQVKAEVIAQLEDGSYIAKIEGAPMRLDLPKGTHVGDNITLRLNRLTPRVSFSLKSSNQALPTKPINNTLSTSQQTISVLPSSNAELNTMMDLQSTSMFSANRAKIDAPISAKSIANVKQSDFVKLTEIGVGNSVKAEVTSQLDDGSYTAKAAGLMLHLDLPMGTQVGDELPLKLNRLSPYISCSIDAPKTALTSPGPPTQSGNIQHEILLLAPSSGYQDLEGDAPVFTAGTSNRSTSMTPPLVTQPTSSAIANYTQILQDPQSTQTQLNAPHLATDSTSNAIANYSQILQKPQNTQAQLNAPHLATDSTSNAIANYTQILQEPQSTQIEQKAEVITPQDDGSYIADLKGPPMHQDSVDRAKIDAPMSGKWIDNAKQDVLMKLSEIGVGNSVQAEVTSQLDDGSFTANVAGLMLHLELPMGTQVGDHLSLQLNRLSPYISFLTDAPKTALTSPGLPAQSGSPRHEILLLAPASGYQDLKGDASEFATESANHSTSIAPQPITPHASNAIANYAQVLQNPQSVQTELSSTGQLISHLLGETNTTGHEGLKLAEDHPLIDHATAGPLTENLPAILATQLKQSVDKSGYFYESHVIDFLQGKRSIQELQQEPQFQIYKNELTEDEQHNLETKNENHSLTLDSLTTGQILLDQNDNKHQELAEIVRQQLTILEHNKFVMSGMLAPNIPFSWEMFDQDKFDATRHARENLDESAIRHHSFLKVELPNLGVVAIHIDLQSNQVQLSMKSQTELGVQELNAHANQLVQSLELSGTRLQSFKASRDEQL